MAHLLLSPLTWGLLALLVAWRARSTGWRRLGLGGALLCAVLGAPLGANALVAGLERLPVSPRCAADEHTPLVVLGGGFQAVPASATDVMSLSPASQRRVAAGVDLAARQPGTPVYLAGGPTSAFSEAVVMQALALRLGAPAQDLHLEAGSVNTQQNAANVAALLPPGTRRIQLVTSAWHMARAEAAFTASGLTVCRHELDSLWTPPTGVGYVFPQSSSLAKAERVAHELLGLLLQRVRGA